MAISNSLTARIHEQTSRQLEAKFDLEAGKSILVPNREFERPERRAKKQERFRGAQNGIDPHAVANELKALREHSDSGQSFRAAMETAGYVLARGDRRDFVVDRSGRRRSQPCPQARYEGGRASQFHEGYRSLPACQA